MYRCVHCGLALSSLVVLSEEHELLNCVRPRRSGSTLTVQPACKHTADNYVELPIPPLFLDLVLQKRTVYSHLLFNRGAYADRTWALGAVVIALDACTSVSSLDDHSRIRRHQMRGVRAVR